MAGRAKRSGQSKTGVTARKTAISVAVSAALLGFNGPLHAQSDSGGDALEEIIVTASRRSENLQDVAFSIQAFGQEELERRRLLNLENYARFVPTLSYFSQTPGSAKIVFRGVADTPSAFIAQSSAALYLDEQPLTQNFNVDVRMVDIERLEALSGPQGTLYGDSSQSGTLRIITNKPDPTGFAASASAMLRTGSDSDTSYDVTGMLNLPLIEDKLAIRLVGFSAEDGGFVDNVLGVTPRFGLSDNANLVEDNWNGFSVSGGRAAARWFINSDWTATASAVFQDSKADGLNEFDPTVGDLQVVRFHQEVRDDEWQQFGLTLEGKIGELNFLSSTAYFNRDVAYTNDRTAYASYFATFCYYNGAGVQAAPAYCFGGTNAYDNDAVHRSDYVQENTRFTQEFRISGGNSRWDWLAGAFYEKKTEEWDYTTVASNDYSLTPAFAYWSGLYNIAPDVNTWWNSHDDTETTQYAVFGEANVHFDDRWTLTAGGRFYDTDFTKRYLVERPDSRLDAASNPGGNPPGVSNPTGADDGFLPKISLKYQFAEDVMVYGLYSEGFRAGGANRGRGNPAVVVVPFSFDADTVKNHELGFKSRFAGGRVQLNATIFHMVWEDAQFEITDPSFNFANNEPFQVVVGNVFDAVNDGVELSLTALLTDNLELGLSAAWLNAETDTNADVCGTADTPALVAECQSTFAGIPKGSQLPLAPEVKGAASLQYNFPLAGRDAYVLAQYSFNGSSVNQLEATTLADGPGPQLEQPSYSISDLSAGLRGDSWEATVFINNVGDERAVLYANPYYFDYFWGGARQSVNRPREYGIKFAYRWE